MLLLRAFVRSVMEIIFTIISASTNEMKRLLTLLDRQERSISKSSYLGDLLVTCYSLHSRNRRFGSNIGKGLTVDETKSEMKMVQKVIMPQMYLPHSASKAVDCSSSHCKSSLRDSV